MIKRSRLIYGNFRYLTYPRAIPNGWKYRLLESIEVLTGIEPFSTHSSDFMSINSIGVLRLKAGYSWNGASGPCLDCESIMYPSTVHDALCQLFSLGVLTKGQRYEADDLLRRMVKAEMYRISDHWSVAPRLAYRTWASVWSRTVWLAVRSYSMIQ